MIKIVLKNLKIQQVKVYPTIHPDSISHTSNFSSLRSKMTHFYQKMNALLLTEYPKCKIENQTNMKSLITKINNRNNKTFANNINMMLFQLL